MQKIRNFVLENQNIVPMLHTRTLLLFAAMPQERAVSLKIILIKYVDSVKTCPSIVPEMPVIVLLTSYFRRASLVEIALVFVIST